MFKKVIEAKPADGSNRCDGYGHHPHDVKEQLYRVQGSTAYLCWECLLLMGSEHLAPNPPQSRSDYLRRGAIR